MQTDANATSPPLREAHSNPAMVPSLDFLGLKCGTDKATGGHGYLQFYERFFRDLREHPVNLLEVGVFHGESVKMWSEYFQSGRIIGVDIDPVSCRYANERVLIEIADQSNVANLVRLGVQYGPFDIIVDDGSHMWNHQITTLQYLYPFLKPGGFFVMEDIDTSFGAYVNTYKGTSSISAAEYLRKMTDYLVADVQLDISAEQDSFIRTFARATEFIAFHRRTAILRLHPSSLVDTFTGVLTKWVSFPPLVAAEPTDSAVPQAWLMVHLGGMGDVANGCALIGGLRGDRARTIQGFTIDLKKGRHNELQYRALLNDDVWTDWIPGGSFVGTRGKSAALRGFAVRLVGDLACQFECCYAGAFVDTPNLVQASDGRDCQTTTGADLEAMHIVLRSRARSPAWA